jgi:hypothetical protein
MYLFILITIMFLDAAGPFAQQVGTTVTQERGVSPRRTDLVYFIARLVSLIFKPKPSATRLPYSGSAFAK